MNHEIELVADGDGVALIGDSTAIERFLEAEQLAFKDLGLQRLASVSGKAGAVAQAGATAVANSGRWVKLTEKSAAALKGSGQLMKGSSATTSRAVLTDKGKISHVLEIAKPGTALANPALLTGVAGLMTQLAMQQTMDQITDYLAVIDEKVDDVLRAQKDGALSRAIGVGLIIDEAMTVRAARGKVDEITWSKVQGAPATIAETQAYAVRQLDALIEKLESKAQKGDFAATAKEVETKGREWLVVLARTFQLQEGMAVLELDRVLDATPDEVEAHRRGLSAAREERLQMISQRTVGLLDRANAAAERANARVLLNPVDSRDVVQASIRVGADVVDFHAGLGIDQEREALEARRWSSAAWDARDRALEAGEGAVCVAKRFGGLGLDKAKSAGGRVSGRFSDRRRSSDADAESTKSQGNTSASP